MSRRGRTGPRRAARGLAAALLLGAALAACDTAPLSPPPAELIARPGSGFFDLPFPDNRRRTDDGRLDVRGFPNPANLSLLDGYLEAIATHNGGPGLNSPVYLRFAGAPTAAALPNSAATRDDPAAGIALVDITPASATYGQRTPLVLDWRPHGGEYLPAGVLAAAPVPGFPLRPGTTYALVVYDGFAGWRIAASAWFTERRQDADAAGLTALIDRGDLPPDPVAGAIFTTQDAVAPLVAAAATIEAHADYPRLVTWQAMPAQGACRRVEATVAALTFQHGTKPYLNAGGDWRLDAAGAPLVAGPEHMRAVLSVPTGAMPAAGWPLLLMAHGTGSDADSWSRTRCTDPAGAYCQPPYTDATATECYCATVLCHAGIASLASEQPLHGTRLPADSTIRDRQILTFNLFNIPVIRDNLRQGAADLVSLLRWAGELDADATEFPLGEAFRIDPERLVFMGHSQGTNTGVPFLALRGHRFRGAVLSGASGGLSLALLYKVEPYDFPALLELGLMSPDDFDLFHPALAVFQAFAEPADTLNYGRYLLREPLVEADDWRPLHLFVSEGIVDTYTPPPLLEALATTLGELQWLGPRLKGVPPYVLLDKGPAAGPVQGNVAGPGGPWTAVHLQYPQGHWSLFEDASGGQAFTRFLIDAAAGNVPEVEPR